MSSLSEDRPLPSAMLLGTDTAARRNWLVSVYNSSFGNVFVMR